jgi:hypothetical protein
MDRQPALLQLAQQLSAATAAADWPAVAACYSLLHSVLPQLAQQAPWTPAELAALSALRELHQATVAKVDVATAAAGQHLQQLQDNREGWLAYALDSEIDTTGL